MSKQFIESFITAALWSSTYEHIDCEDCREGRCNPNCDDGEHDLSDKAKRLLTTYGEKLYSAMDSILEDYDPEAFDCLDSQAGHDSWLTSQGHGAGFWDGDWQEPQATKLEKICKAIVPEGIHFYINEPEGELHIFGAIEWKRCSNCQANNVIEFASDHNACKTCWSTL